MVPIPNTLKPTRALDCLSFMSTAYFCLNVPVFISLSNKSQLVPKIQELYRKNHVYVSGKGSTTSHC